MLKYRLLSGSILVQFVISTLFLSSQLFFFSIVLLVCMLAAWEWGKLSGFDRNIDCFWVAMLYSLLLALSFFFILKFCIAIHHQLVTIFLHFSLAWWFVALLLVIFYPSSARIWATSKALRLIFGIFTVTPFFWSVIVLRAFRYDENRYIGALWLLYVMILAWGIDTGSYVFGSLFGKHKLAPKISPKKTWQGLVGGLLTTSVFLYAYGSLVNLEATPLTLVICSVPSALAAVLGDLTESMLKRVAGVKDSSCLIPGHGGVLDRIDSLTAAIPVFVFLLVLVCEKSNGG